MAAAVPEAWLEALHAAGGGGGGGGQAGGGPIRIQRVWVLAPPGPSVAAGPESPDEGESRAETRIAPRRRVPETPIPPTPAARPAPPPPDPRSAERPPVETLAARSPQREPEPPPPPALRASRPQAPPPATAVARPEPPTTTPGSAGPSTGSAGPKTPGDATGTGATGGGGRGAPGPLGTGPPGDAALGEHEVDRVAAPLRPVRPVYPPSEKMLGREARVELGLVVSADGRVEEVEVLRSGGRSFDRASVEALRRARFRPARRDGRPVPSRIRYTVHYRLDG